MGGRKTARSRRRRHRRSLKSRKVSRTRARVSKRSRVSSRGQKGGARETVEEFFRANHKEDLIPLLEQVDDVNLDKLVMAGFDTPQHEGTPGHRKVNIMDDLQELWVSLDPDKKKFNDILRGFLDLDMSLSQPDPESLTLDDTIEGLTHEIETKMALLQRIGAPSIGPDIAGKILSSYSEQLEQLKKLRRERR